MLENLKDKTYVTGIITALVAILTAFGVDIFDEATINNIIAFICAGASLVAFTIQTINKIKAKKETEIVAARLEKANARLNSIGIKEI